MATATRSRSNPVIIPPNKRMLWSISNSKTYNIWEGSVRSGKTLASIISFLLHIEASPDMFFFMSGNTVQSLYNNVIDGTYGILKIHAGSRWVKNESTLYIPTSQGVKTVRCFGASDYNSHDKLTGLTAGGWYADELNKHHMNFVIEATKRTVASPTRKHFATMNPDNPQKDIYKKFVDYYRLMTPEEKANIGGVNYWHCTLDDNPALTTEQKEAIKAEYVHKGFEYDRYILGKRVVAEGLIYPGVQNRNVFVDFDIKDVKIQWAAIDWGVDHPTVILMGGQFMQWNEGQEKFKAIPKQFAITHELYLTDKAKVEYDIVDRFEHECTKLSINPKSVRIAIDPSAVALKNAFFRRGYMAQLGHESGSIESANNRVLDGLSYTRMYLYSGVLKIHKSCVNTQREISAYSWDTKASERGEERPIKVFDDCMDAMRYFSNTFIRERVGTVIATK